MVDLPLVGYEMFPSKFKPVTAVATWVVICFSSHGVLGTESFNIRSLLCFGCRLFCHEVASVDRKPGTHYGPRVVDSFGGWRKAVNRKVRRLQLLSNLDRFSPCRLNDKLCLCIVLDLLESNS
jgi:hypothetical protein